MVLASLMTPFITMRTAVLRGKNLTETEHVKLGAYHTVELEPQRPFSLEKQAWDAIDIERIHQATDPAASADLAAVLITVSPPPMLGLMTAVLCAVARSAASLSNRCLTHSSLSQHAQGDKCCLL